MNVIVTIKRQKSNIQFSLITLRNKNFYRIRQKILLLVILLESYCWITT